MASPNAYSSGATSGARLATRAPLLTSGKTWYVCNASGANGADAAGTAGQQRQRPLLTTAQAITNASAGDTIQYLEGHVEALSAGFTASKAGLHFYSEGTEATRAVISTTSAITMATVSASGVWFENITFSLAHASASAVLSSGAITGLQFISCSFSSSLAVAYIVNFVSAVTAGKFRGCTWTSTATSIANRPSSGLVISSAASELELESCTFNGGTMGWGDYALRATAAVTRLTAIDLDLLNGSDCQVATGSVYRVHVRNASGGSWTELTA